MLMVDKELKERVTELRKRGDSYLMISEKLGVRIPKGTLSTWFRNLELSSDVQQIILERSRASLAVQRQKALTANAQRREMYLSGLRAKNRHLPLLLDDKEMAKLFLVALYWAEGGKNRRGALSFGNSDPQMITYFPKLLRFSFNIVESKFRCIVQCRADQADKKLQEYWSGVTAIPLFQFYRDRVDARTVGRPTRKIDYKGVCRIEYLDAHVYNEIMQIIGVLVLGP